MHIGKIVLFWPFEESKPDPLPGIVTGITNSPNPEQRVALHVFDKHAQFDVDSVPYSHVSKPGHWSHVETGR